MLRTETLRLERIVGGGQAIGTLESGKKAFVWGGLPGELVEFRVTKKKSKLVEGVVSKVLEPSGERVEPKDLGGFLSTSPWQTMSFEHEQQTKVQLIDEAFTLHSVTLPGKTDVFTDDRQYCYRNKVEFSWWGDEDEQGNETLDLAFFRRGSKGKVAVDGTSLASEPINILARGVRDFLHSQHISARSLKTLLIRCDQAGNCVFQLYVKEQATDWTSVFAKAPSWQAKGWEVIYSDPRSPASRITERLLSFGETTLEDTVLGVPFRYATEGFFQVNVPVYEQALRDMKEWASNKTVDRRPKTVESAQTAPADTTAASEPEASAFSAGVRQITLEISDKRVTRGGAAPTSSEARDDGADRAAGPASSDLCTEHATGGAGDDGSGQKQVIDLYSGVGTIGLTIGGENCVLVETDENAVREMKRNVSLLNSSSKPILARSEDALEYITSNRVIIVDPPRAGMHTNVINRLLEVLPPRIIYLSCNPVTQARDVALLLEKYHIAHHKGYNFFPRTPHIEHLVVLELI